MSGLKSFALVAAVRGGARWENERQSGWSHLLEHLVFKGAGDMSAREIVERIEAEGGSINAATGYERTGFEVRGLAEALPGALNVVADLMLRPALDPAEIEREKDVVAQEIAEAFDTPDDHVFEMAQTRAFQKQSLGRPILGSVASLAPVDRAGIEAWRAALYAPERMVVVASGAVDEDELVRLAEAAFGSAVSQAVEAPAKAVFTGGHARLPRRIEQANLVFQLPAFAADDPDLPALRLTTEILGGGMASRLFQSAREERGLAYAIDAYHEPYEDAGLLGIYAGAAADRAEELARVCAQEVRALAEDGPTEVELSRAKAVLTAGLWMSEESPMSRAGRLAVQTLVFGGPLEPLDQVERLKAVTVDQARGAARRLLAPGLTATSVLGPRAAGAAGRVFEQALFG
ncbi:insulinase family protein [Brevundimonas sp. S30B]|nr:insulinase family protein [Brevundimonas sp. MF30-B]TFW01753.1 insulinase family protein [Brevundimonas sp. S30B]